MEKGHRQSPDARATRAPSTAERRLDVTTLLRGQMTGCDENVLHLELREWGILLPPQQCVCV